MASNPPFPRFERLFGETRSVCQKTSMEDASAGKSAVVVVDKTVDCRHRRPNSVVADSGMTAVDASMGAVANGAVEDAVFESVGAVDCRRTSWKRDQTLRRPPSTAAADAVESPP